VRLYDLVVISKDADGSVLTLEVDQWDQLGGGFGAFKGARSGLLSEEDFEAAGEALNPGTTAALIVFENAWAIPFVEAALSEGGSVVASARIPAADVIAALDALENA
jgi:hypothetical protein